MAALRSSPWGRLLRPACGTPGSGVGAILMRRSGRQTEELFPGSSKSASSFQAPPLRSAPSDFQHGAVPGALVPGHGLGLAELVVAGKHPAAVFRLQGKDKGAAVGVAAAPGVPVEVGHRAEPGIFLGQAARGWRRWPAFPSRPGRSGPRRHAGQRPGAAAWRCR